MSPSMMFPNEFGPICDQTIYIFIGLNRQLGRSSTIFYLATPKYLKHNNNNQEYCSNFVCHLWVSSEHFQTVLFYLINFALTDWRSVGPDLPNFRHFGELLKSLCKFWGFIISHLGEISPYFCAKNYATVQILSF